MTTRIVFVGPLMSFSVVLCLSLTSLIPVCYTLSTEETSNRYECGLHGKFEYCIDGILGCVIGCHCHPGYYFDTDTKICEPNTKLGQDFRRRYMAEPTLVYPTITPTVVKNFPTPTTTDVLDERVDEITKDTDDIGDWLFDQFFKTIETQVINNTNDEPTPMRRSNLDVYRPAGLLERGGGPKGGNLDIDKIKTKTRKSWRGRGKKKKSKAHGLRRKLLRITEDDSLFDSDSNEGSSGGDSSDESSSSGSSSSSSGTSKEKKKDSNNKNDREHGHKKVIIFNRRPRPPLPSFIFLPSMDTPYYPPIGLPPPPVLPMYPMVPVPPMAPFIPFLDRNNNNGNTTTTTTTAASEASDSTGAESTTVTEASATEATPEASEAPDQVDPDDPSKHTDRRTRQKGHRSRIPIKISSEETFMIRARDMPPRIPNASKQAERMKLVRKLRQRLKKKNRQPPVQEYVVTDEDEETTLLDNNLIPPKQPIRPTQKHSRHRPQTEQDQILNDVNFKYITELIHRVNLSEVNLPPAPINAKTQKQKQLKKLQNTRRNYDPQIPNVLYQDENATPSNAHIQKPEDAYFTNLGRQIASLVRNVEFKLNNNIVNEQGNREELTLPVLQENSYAPRSYWERSVRSPLTTFKNYFDRLHLEKQSGEKNLVSLENEVKTLATTTPSMSLQDLENILSTLQKTHTEDNKSNKSKDQSNSSFNVNLLPNKKTEDTYRKIISPLDYAEYYPRIKYLGNTTNIAQDFTNNNAAHYIDPSNLDSPMIDDWMFDAQDCKQTINSNQQTTNQQTTNQKTTNQQTTNQQTTNQQITNQHTTVNKSLERESTKYNSKPSVPFYKKVNKQKDYLKYHETHPLLTHNTANNFALSAKNHELPVNYPELHTRHAEQPIKYPVLPVKLHEPATKYPELSAKYAEVSAKYPEISAKFHKILTKYPDLPAKYPELLAKYPELLAKYPELLAKYPELSARYSGLTQKHPEVPSKYPMQPVKHQPNPAVVNYKTLDYFSDAENKRHHYTFEASYPLQVPSYRRSFSKRFETNPGERSYFHHDLDHLGDIN